MNINVLEILKTFKSLHCLCLVEMKTKYIDFSPGTVSVQMISSYEAPLTPQPFQKFSSDERNVMFEKLYTNTLFYLAQVYGVRGDNKQAAAHCHITLQRQLEADVGSVFICLLFVVKTL